MLGTPGPSLSPLHPELSLPCAFDSGPKAALDLQGLKGSLQGWGEVCGGGVLRGFLDIKQLLQNF